MQAKKRILYATTNPAKATRMRDLLAAFPVEILNMVDVGITSQAPEDGETPADNARQKVEFAFSKCGIPTLAVDHGLYIEAFSKEKQPGMFVRRIYGVDFAASDVELLNYYQRELNNVGGKSKGTWVTAIAFQTAVSHIYSETFSSETFFTSKASPVIMAGEPLNSLQIDPVSGTYFSEMSPDERIKALGTRAVGIAQFIERHWDKF
jgi:XTP/dITP diphosphohydrolase